jgi:hypothetical protein
MCQPRSARGVSLLEGGLGQDAEREALVDGVTPPPRHVQRLRATPARASAA